MSFRRRTQPIHPTPTIQTLGTNFENQLTGFDDVFEEFPSDETFALNEAVVIPIRFSEVQPEDLFKLFKEKRYTNLKSKFGNVDGVIQALESHKWNGIEGDASDLHQRTTKFGSNTFKPRNRDVVFSLWFPLKALFSNPCFNVLFPTTITLSIKFLKLGQQIWWIFALGFFIQVWVANSQAQKAFRLSTGYKLKILVDEFNKATVKVVRHGVRKDISFREVVIGDLVLLKKGDRIPADGLFVDGDSLQVKTAWNTKEYIDKDSCPFMLFGWKVSNGRGSMLVTCVGENTSWARTLNQGTNKPLQKHFKMLLAIREAVSWLSVLIIPSVMIVGYLGGRKTNEDSVTDVLLAAISILIKNGVNKHHHVFWLKSDQFPKCCPTNGDSDMFDWITTGRVTTIVVDEISILKPTQLEVVEFRLNDEVVETRTFSQIPHNVLNGLREVLAFCEPCSITATELLHSWGRFELGITRFGFLKSHNLSYDVNSEERLSWVFLEYDAGSENEEKTAHCTGDAMMVLSKCSDYHEKDGTKKPLDEDRRAKIEQAIKLMVDNRLLCLALARKHVMNAVGSNGEAEAIQGRGEGEIHTEKNGLTLLGIVSFRRKARETVKSLQNIGVHVKMVSIRDFSKAKDFAMECGVPTAYRNVLARAQQFVELPEQERRNMVQRICVLVSCTSSDDKSTSLEKSRWAEHLKWNNEVVAVTEREEDDHDLLEKADVGFLVESEGAESVKERAKFFTPDDTLSSILNTIKWRRSSYYHLITFIQLQLFAKIAVFILNFISALLSGETYISDFNLLLLDTLIPCLIYILTNGEPLTNEQLNKFHVGRRIVTTILAIGKWPIIKAAILLIAILLPMHFVTAETVLGEGKTAVMVAVLSLAQMFSIFHIKLKKSGIFKMLRV